MNKVDLTTKIEGLKKAIKEHNDFSATYQNELAIVEKQLQDYDKPALTPVQLDAIFEAVDKAVENFSFSNCDNYEVDFSLDYDGRVHCESFDFDNADDLAREIYEYVARLFAEAEDNNELNQD